MLYNHKGQQVKVADRFDSTSNPKIFKELREILEPTDKNCGSMFHIEERARIIDQRKVR